MSSVLPVIQNPVYALILLSALFLFGFPRFWKIYFSLLGLIFLPIISTAHSQEMQFPATGVFNTYNEHINVFECSNLEPSSVSLSLEVKGNEGQTLATLPLQIPGNGSKHLILNHLVNQLSNQYGTLIVHGGGLLSARVACYTMHYRYNAAGSIEYVFALPLRAASSGKRYGLYNSMNPEGSADPVYNWLSLYNPGSSTFSASVHVYDAAGNLDDAQSFRLEALGAGERRDFSLHKNGQRVGLYVIEPDDPDSPYGAFLSRYSQQAASRFSFAFPLEARKGTCSSGPLPASIMENALNWGEIGNLASHPQEIEVLVRDRGGALLEQLDFTLAPHAQRHFFLNDALSVALIGTFEVRCKSAGSESALLVQSMFYGREQGSNAINWAYASSAPDSRMPLSPLGAEESLYLAAPVNTHLGAYNWSKFLQAGGEQAEVDLQIFDPIGQGVSLQFSPQSISGSLDIPYHTEVGPDFYGLAAFRINPSTDVLPFSEVLRVYPGSGGGSEYIMNIPSMQFSAPQPTIFYVDPLHGSMSNDGSEASPWRTLEEVFEQGLIETRVAKSVPWQSSSANEFEPVGGFKARNAGAPVQPGDIILLRSGYHGDVFFRGGYNEDYITIAAEAGHTPILSRIRLSAVAKWKIQGLTITPEAAPPLSGSTILYAQRHGYHGPCRNMFFENNHVYTASDVSAWSAQDWNDYASSGIQMQCPDSAVRGNTLRNVNWGIIYTAERGAVERNTVSGIAGDGMVAGSNNLRITDNVLKNFYNVNANHDDAIQFHRGSDKSTPIENIYMARNTVIDHEYEYPLATAPQGLASFGNPLINWRVENNVVLTDHWHGISLYNIRNSIIINNIAASPAQNLTAWISLGTSGSDNTIVRNNMSRQFSLPGSNISADHNIDLDDYHHTELFVDFLGYDVRHASGSPAINAGSSEGAPSHDIGGQLRDSQPDIGAFEAP